MNNKESQSNDKQIDNDTAKEELGTNEGQQREETLSAATETNQNELSTDNDESSDTENKETATAIASPYAASAGAPPVIVKKSSLGWVITSAVLATALVVVLIKPPFGGGGNETLATINSSKITKDDLYDKLVLRYGTPTLDSMIEDQLVQQEADATSVKLTDQDITNEIEVIKLQYGTDEAFNAELEKNGTTLEKLREDIRPYALISKMLAPKTKVTDEAVQTFFNENKAAFGTTPEQVRASHILVKTKEEADAILADLKAGADFAETAKAKSTDGSAAAGGDLNFFPKGQMVPAFEEAVFALEVGAISDVVKSDFGFHIIKKTDYKAAYEPKFEDKKGAIRTMLIGQEVNQLAGPWLAELRTKAKITNTLEKKEPVADKEAPATK
ncbi:peptidylprolyl isomerase [Paenibacillus sp. GSMTC-2017]|uniref:peptidylprolyl isomerase n=1 Tax=Paenibacillus sp. GSMTC-2017 TaxID=2794350 RepID=UPI0018D6F4D7|nr:peptidylprolyl isomerase [Paenibacillus sp. GSMTC-2017]MBH5318668.1 peptidylprolyl isomerase [Paenibacillus sp. GSMTC-2017]